MTTTRRDWLLQASAVLLLAPVAPARAAPAPTRLAAAWDDAQGRHYAGWLAATGGATLRVEHAIELPTRAHGLLPEADGSVLVVARRPGDWLLRWRPGRAGQWQWSEPERRYSGHAIAAHGRLYTTETELDSGTGRVVVRDAATLESLQSWPTGGIDPHQLLLDIDGTLLVANGGVPTQPETGRVKLARDRMDPSLVRLDPRDGRRLGQWRLPDPRLSIRHLARHADGTIGVALQAEHDDAAERAAAPLLALFDRTTLRCAGQPHALAGYAGDIAATRDGFALAATRAGGVVRWRSDGTWLGFTPLAEACPLACDARGALWAGGRGGALAGHAEAALALPALRLDNHWISAPAA